MRGLTATPPYICSRCLRAGGAKSIEARGRSIRYASSDAAAAEGRQDGEQSEPRKEKEKEKGAMSRRLSELSEESLESGGRSARKAVEEAGFSEELKRKLEDKIANASFKSENASAFAQASMPASAGRGTRDIAAARPWSGTESVEDASLRMLNDAYKPMRVAPRVPGLRGPPKSIDTGRPKNRIGAGTRLANARDRTSMYESIRDSGLSDQEREKLRQEMKMRFAPTARAVPGTITGLQSLADERIQDAIARGKFKNLPRGQKIERDYNMSSPFIDTTEYFMNKIIQRQDIVPPWIEKQQELVSTASKFRSRLRADWRRHAARVISSKGGGLERQVRLAEEYAFAESVENPTKKKLEQLNAVDDKGQLSQITLAGELKVADEPASSTSASADEEANVEDQIKIVERTFNDDGTLRPQPDETITVTTEHSGPPSGAVEQQGPSPRRPTVPPFRDAEWEQTERGYHVAAVNNLNSLTRSYNLMAPALARKPYFYLDRELKACFSDVAPQVAAAIKERALAPKIKSFEVVGHKPGGVLNKFSTDKAAHVYDERKPQYGFKQFWKDLFSGDKA